MTCGDAICVQLLGGEGQELVPHHPRRFLDPATLLPGNVSHRTFAREALQAVPFGEIPDPRQVFSRPIAELVVEVGGANLEPELIAQPEEKFETCHRIRAAGNGDQDTLHTSKHALAGGECSDLADNALD
ncbi:MAG TPA: hypothetical protein PJ994_01460 [Tepidiformaceae bacterium]|nr:hypothetical protein [Tepidiformaceae bacterium]